MFPLFSVANNLLKAGWRVVIVADEHHRDTIAEMGVEFFSVGGKRDGTRRLRWETINSLAGHSILDEYSVTMKAAMGVDVIVGNQGAFVGRIVSKATGIPWVYCPVSPLALLSDGQPPLFPLIGRMQRRYRSCRFFQRLAVWGARLFTRVTTYKIVRFQSKLGVWDKKNPRFEGMYSEDLNLLLTSSHLVRSRIDWPNNTVIPGFAWFEPGFMVDAAKTSALSEFLTSGEAPVVIAPGGMVRVDPGNFYEKAIEAVKETLHKPPSCSVI